jgi:hypothetical protein
MSPDKKAGVIVTTIDQPVVGVPRAFGVACHLHFPAPPQNAQQST